MVVFLLIGETIEDYMLEILFSFKPLLFDLPYFSEKMNLFHLVFDIPELGFPGSSDGKASAYDAGDLGSIPGSGRSPGEGNGNPLQYSCLENPMDRGAWYAPRGCKESDRTEQLHFTSYQN